MIRCVPAPLSRYGLVPRRSRSARRHSGRGRRDNHHSHAPAFHRGI